MPVTDPIADMLTRIRNANTAYHEQVDIPNSKIKKQIANILKREGFIKDFQTINTGIQSVLRLYLKYGQNKEKVILGLKRISKPGLRVYISKDKIPNLFGGLGLIILSTSKGIINSKQAKFLKVGGEVLCYVW